MAGGSITVQVGETELLVETVPVSGTQATSRVGDAAQGVRDAFVRAQNAIVEVATSTIAVLDQAGRRAARPDALEVEFGLKFSAQGNVIVAGSAGEATLRVKLTYNRPVPSPPAGAPSAAGAPGTAGS
ncbi:CU044_2847 family protein [Streptomyces sp. NPDC058464]|uniref:CU044_2847 family protein n=1 Tax=Streptomyces sp. NPDC058464 TaxID=3346511 RepID=UPI0036538C76